MEATILKRQEKVRKECVERRLRDLQRIQSLNLTNPSGLHPLELFPKELWTIILSDLEDPMDLHNASITCPLFEEVLRKRFLLHSIFPRLFALDIFLPNKLVPKQFPDIQALQEEKQLLLSLRPVCKALRDLVDAQFERKLTNYESAQFGSPSLDFLSFQSIEAIPVVTVSLEDRKALRFFLRNRNGPKLHLVSRAVNLRLNLKKDDENNEDLLESLVEDMDVFLNAVGVDIWHFRFDHYLMDFAGATYLQTFTQLYSMLRSWVLQMPKLKWLHIHPSHYPGPNDNDPQNQFGFRSILERHPFPTLTLMQKLNLRISCVDHLWLGVALLNPNLHVRELVVNLNFVEDVGAKANLSKTIRKLDLHSFSYCTGGPQPMPDIRAVSNPKWNLKRLRIEVDYPSRVAIKELFSFLESFQGLEEVVLQIYEVEGNCLSLKLPNVRKLSISFTPKVRVECGSEQRLINDLATSIDYLEPLEKLEELTWNMRARLNGFMHLVWWKGTNHELNLETIWKVFPKLKFVHAEVYFDVREWVRP